MLTVLLCLLTMMESPRGQKAHDFQSKQTGAAYASRINADIAHFDSRQNAVAANKESKLNADAVNAQSEINAKLVAFDSKQKAAAGRPRRL